MRHSVLLLLSVLALTGCPSDPECGNGEIEEGEDCDDGGVSVACDADCTVVECGDGVVNDLAGEECDGSGPDNSSCSECAVVCSAEYEDCNDDLTDGCEVSLCGGTCEAPGETRTFEYTGAIVPLTVPECAATVTVEAWGAQGGGGPTVTGGLGARMKAEISVDAAKDVRVLVGGEGQDAANDSEQGGGSGGGGSFVVVVGEGPWVVAGGGGGALYSLGGVSTPAELDGGPGQTTEAGQAGDAGGAGGIDGNGGVTFAWAGWHAGTGGGGFFTGGVGATEGREVFGTPNQPGSGFVDGGAGGIGGSEGRDGGFGGGGSAGFTGGGGGGYSGGGAGGFGDEGAATHGGGGGGSFAAGTVIEAEAGVREGDGQVVITWVP